MHKTYWLDWQQYKDNEVRKSTAIKLKFIAHSHNRVCLGNP